MNPLQAADMSNAGTPGSPSSAPIKQAVDGKTISGVIVPTTISSISAGVSPAASMARRAAAVPRVAVVSPSETIRRSRMPVRWTIQSSLVSTIRANSSLVRRFSGRQLPVPAMMAPKVGMALDFGFWIAYFGLEGNRAAGPFAAQSKIQNRKSKITVSLFPAGDAGGDAFDDLLVDAAPHELLADADGVADRAGVAAAVADQAVAAHPEQGRAAVLLPVVLRVDLLHHRLELAERFRGEFLQ